jgi:HAD superfamily hydrolase (TIGR01490 family)
MATWAVFDIDGTLLPGMSMEKEFLRYLLAGRLLPAANLVRFAVKGLAGILAQGWEEAPKVNKSYLKGLYIGDVDAYAQACFRTRIAPAISKDGLQTLEAMRERGHGILVISGAPAFLMRCLEPIVRPDYAICTTLEAINGCYTGQVVGLHPFGRRKRYILQGIGQDLDIDFPQSVVYANHHSDVYHMRLFGKAVAVNPTRRLRKSAAEAGWEIAIWA